MNRPPVTHAQPLLGQAPSPFCSIGPRIHVRLHLPRDSVPIGSSSRDGAAPSASAARVRRVAFSVEENAVFALTWLHRETEGIKSVHRMRAAKEMDSDYLRDGGGASTLSGGLCGRTTRVPWTPAGTMYPF